MVKDDIIGELKQCIVAKNHEIELNKQNVEALQLTLKNLNRGIRKSKTNYLSSSRIG